MKFGLHNSSHAHSLTNADDISFLQMHSKWLLNSKAPSHEVDTFTHIKGLLYKHGLKSKILGTAHPQILACHSTC